MMTCSGEAPHQPKAYAAIGAGDDYCFAFICFHHIQCTPFIMKIDGQGSPHQKECKYSSLRKTRPTFTLRLNCINHGFA